MNAFDPVGELRSAGIPVDDLSEAHREALATLTEAEVAVLVDIGHRLAMVEPEVMAHGEVIGGLFF